MLSDNILQFSLSNNTLDRDKVVNNRRNPFLYDNDVCTKVSVNHDMSTDRLENNLLVYNHFDLLPYCNQMSSVEDLTKAVRECKLKILSLVDDPESKSKFIERLIELNERLYTIKELSKSGSLSASLQTVSSSIGEDSLTIVGHRFTKYRFGFGLVRHCEVCHGTVRTARTVYRCTYCDVHIHMAQSCLQGMHRSCPAADRCHTYTGCFIDIDYYPLTGNLSSQNFLCAECSHPLRAVSSSSSDSSGRSLTKFCHYNRKFYCSSCHWDNKFLIPSIYFMLNKWKKMSVCRSAFIKLKYMWDKALFRMPLFWQQNNPGVENVLIIRKKLFSLRLFLDKCVAAKKLSGSSPEWLIEQPYLVSMSLVETICDGSALEMVQVLYSGIVAHVPQCELCQSLCDTCHLCQDPERLFVVSSTVWTCSSCLLSCIHEKCGLIQYKEKSEYVCHNCYKE